MNEDHRTPAVHGARPATRTAPALPVRLVPFHGVVPEQLSAFFERLTPWTWRDLRTVFCRHPETRRLVNIIRTIDQILEKAPHTLARGHWSIAGYREALEKLGSAITRLGHIAGLVAGDARVRLPRGPEPRTVTASPSPRNLSTGGFRKHEGGLKTMVGRSAA